jgi:hypothetical protein
MDIPISVPLSINPHMNDILYKSNIIHFKYKDALYRNNGSLVYYFPYSPNTFWTNFKYKCYEIGSNIKKQMNIGVELNTNDNYMYNIVKQQDLEYDIWHELDWPIPSTYVTNKQSGVYFVVNIPTNIFGEKLNVTFEITLLGFIDLFPKSTIYLLKSSMNTYQFLFSDYTTNSDSNNSSVIMNVENQCYVDDIEKNAIIINKTHM